MQQTKVESMIFETDEIKRGFIKTLNTSKNKKIFTVESTDIFLEKPELMLSESKGQWYIYALTDDNPSVYAFNDLKDILLYAQDTYKDNYLQLGWSIMENILMEYSRLFLDTSVFSAIITKINKEHVFIATKILSLIERGTVEALASVISLSDILPLGKSEHEQSHLYLLMNKFKNLTWTSVDADTVRETTKYFNKYQEDFKSSLVIASAINSNNHNNGKIAFISIGEPTYRLIELDHYAFYKS